jgi:hypothetical protein
MVVSIAGSILLKPKLCDHENPAIAAKGEGDVRWMGTLG